MNKHRLGCLSPIAMIASVITLLVIGGFAFTSGSGVFSPGALNARAGERIGGVTSHAAIGNDCNKCHTAPWDVATLTDRCQTCHQEIAARLREPNSLHSALLKGSPVTCRGCHSEHRGANAALTEMQPGSFPHEKTGYTLQSHQRHKSGLPFTCSDCHGEDVSRFDLPTCAACHGPDGKGNPALGAPNLTDHIWLHGGTLEDIEHSIGGGRQGAMPAWSTRLTNDQIRVLAAYVYHLSHQGDAAAGQGHAQR